MVDGVNATTMFSYSAALGTVTGVPMRYADVPPIRGMGSNRDRRRFKTTYECISLVLLMP